MKIAITGASGFIGSALASGLASAGHSAVPLPRPWDIVRLSGADALVHLAGVNIGDRVWTAARKKIILESRAGGTRQLAEALAKLPNPPKALICASAMGYYGSRGGEWLDENAAAGGGFLAEVCRSWEAAAQPARDRGIRVVHLRFGLVLARHGGVLKKMLLPFRLGFGGPVGTGEQFVSWVALDDALGAVQFILNNPSLSGAVNVATSSPVTSREFSKALGRALKRPAIFPLPAFVVRLIFGRMGEETLLASQRLKPQKLLNAGFTFRHGEIGEALKKIL